MRYIRTVKVPIHYALGKEKRCKLDKLTARLSYGTSLFLDIIKETDISSKKDLAQFEKDVQNAAKLSAGFVQQCKDKAVWMNKSYIRLHKSWQRKVDRCIDEKYLKKLKGREPSFPDPNGKIPVRMDSRTVRLITKIKLNGKLVKPLKNDLELTGFWLDLSTLILRKKMMIPLNPSNYHINKLKGCKRIIDCEIVKRKNKYYAHLSCEYFSANNDVCNFKAVDLGIIRSISAVSLDGGRNYVKDSFKVFSDKEFTVRLEYLDEKIEMQQYKQNWKYLKKLRQRRANIAEDYMRKSSKAFAQTCKGYKIFIGHPKYIKYRNYKGNGNKIMRKKLARWAYAKQISYIKQSCESLGVAVCGVGEGYTSKTCSNCGNTKMQRPYKNTYSLVHCSACHKTYNSDFNGAFQIGKKSIKLKRSTPSFLMGGLDMHQHVIKMTKPQYADELAQKQVRA